MNIINYCLNKYSGSGIGSGICNNNNNSQNQNEQIKKSSITINLKPDEDLEFSFTSICSNNNNNNNDNSINICNNNNNKKDKSVYNCICSSGKKYEWICTNCNSKLLCTSCLNSGIGGSHLNHKLLKVELNSIVFQKVFKLNQNILLLENAKSNYCKVEQLIIDNHNNNSNLNNNNCNNNSSSCNNNNSNQILNKELDKYIEFIDLAIKNVIEEDSSSSHTSTSSTPHGTISIKI